MLPLLGPSNPRDTAGLAVDSAASDHAVLRRRLHPGGRARASTSSTPAPQFLDEVAEAQGGVARLLRLRAQRLLPAPRRAGATTDATSAARRRTPTYDDSRALRPCRERPAAARLRWRCSCSRGPRRRRRGAPTPARGRRSGPIEQVARRPAPTRTSSTEARRERGRRRSSAERRLRHRSRGSCSPATGAASRRAQQQEFDAASSRSHLSVTYGRRLDELQQREGRDHRRPRGDERRLDREDQDRARRRLERHPRRLPPAPDERAVEDHRRHHRGREPGLELPLAVPGDRRRAAARRSCSSCCARRRPEARSSRAEGRRWRFRQSAVGGPAGYQNVPGFQVFSLTREATRRMQGARANRRAAVRPMSTSRHGKADGSSSPPSGCPVEGCDRCGRCCRHRRRLRQPRWSLAALPGRGRADPAHLEVRRHRADPGRDRHRQGARGTRDPLPRLAPRRPLRADQLRGHSRIAGGERALRIRARRLHRAHANPGRA